MIDQSSSQNPVIGLSERLLDEALVEAVSKSADFLKSFGAFVGFADGGARSEIRVETQRSFVHGTGAAAGETDVLLRIRTDTGRSICVLSESKVTAGFQPRQGQRYQDRARAIQSAEGVEATTVLLAPSKYLQMAPPEAQYFAYHLPLELAVSWFSDDQRTTLRSAALFRALIERANDGRPLGAKGLFPELHYALGAELSRRANGISITNRPTDWVFMEHRSALPAGAKLRYRIRDGIAELRFRGRAASNLSELMARAHPPLTTAVHKNETSFGVRVTVSREGRSGAPTAADVANVALALEELLSWFSGSLPAPA